MFAGSTRGHEAKGPGDTTTRRRRHQVQIVVTHPVSSSPSHHTIHVRNHQIPLRATIKSDIVGTRGTILQHGHTTRVHKSDIADTGHCTPILKSPTTHIAHRPTLTSACTNTHKTSLAIRHRSLGHSNHKCNHSQHRILPWPLTHTDAIKCKATFEDQGGATATRRTSPRHHFPPSCSPTPSSLHHRSTIPHAPCLSQAPHTHSHCKGYRHCSLGNEFTPPPRRTGRSCATGPWLLVLAHYIS
jgi:hypothetical protein